MPTKKRSRNSNKRFERAKLLAIDALELSNLCPVPEVPTKRVSRVRELGVLETQSFMLATRVASARGAQGPDPRANILARDLNMEFSAVTTMLATAREDSFTIVGADGPAGTDNVLPEALANWSEEGRGGASRGACRWRQSSHHGRPIDLFVAALQPTGGEEVLVVSLFDPLNGAGREEIERRFAQRRALALSYLEIWQLGQSRRTRESALESALSTMRTGVVLLDDEANVFFSNSVADSVLKAADCLKLHRGRLLATNLRDNVRLTVALQHVAMLGDSEDTDKRVPMLSFECSNHTKLILLALPLHTGQGAHRNAVTILHIVDPKLDFSEQVRPLCSIYQLSRTETDLTCLLAKGLTLTNAAELLRLKEQTARSTLRSIFSKTGTGRQTELVLLLLSRVVPTCSALKIEAF